MTGSPYGFLSALTVILIWAASGFVIGFTSTWHTLLGTFTTVVTFLMVFAIQQAQNKSTLAIQLKLNELISSNAEANNKLVDIEGLTVEELAIVKKFYVKLGRRSEHAEDVRASHSLDESGASRSLPPR